MTQRPFHHGNLRAVLLDEATTGLDPHSRQAVWQLIAAFKDAGIATLLATRYREEADALSDRIVVIDQGAVIPAGPTDELPEHPAA